MTQKATGELRYASAAGSSAPALAAWELLGPLCPGEVRLVSLDAGDERLLACAHAVLNSAERARADAFRRDSSRSRMARLEFIVGRGWLRLLLAASAAGGMEPVDLPIETGDHGKPYVDASLAVPEFNVAHSHGQVMIGLAQTGPFGIDLEFVDAAVEVLEVARDSFAPAEVAAIERAAPGSDRLDAFYRCWTAKEAVAKADGRGLNLALNSFFLPQDGEGSVSISLEGQPAARREYFVRRLPCPTGYRAALATGFREVFCSGWQIDSYDERTRLNAINVEECTTSAPSVDACPVAEGAIRVPSCGISLESDAVYGGEWVGYREFNV